MPLDDPEIPCFAAAALDGPAPVRRLDPWLHRFMLLVGEDVRSSFTQLSIGTSDPF